MKKIVCIMFCVLFLSTVFSVLPVQALSKTEGKVTIKSSKTTYVAGEEISVKVNVSCGTSIKSFNLSLTYDKNILEFSESKTKRIQEVNGDFQQYVYSDRLRVTYAYKDTGKILSGDASDAITLVFKVKKNAPNGTTSITPSAGTVDSNPSSVDTKPFINKDGKNCKVTYEAARLTISSAASMKANAKLSALTVKGCTLRPKFNSDTTAYTLYVPEGVTTIAPKAVTVNSSARAKIDAVRKNNVVTKIRIKVTAADKTTTMTYELAIKHGDPPASSAATSSQESSDASSAVSSEVSSTPSSEVSSAPSSEPSSEPVSEESSLVESAEPAAAVSSETSSDLPSSSEPQDFWGSLVSQVSGLPKNPPMLVILAVFIILVLLLVALPLSRNKKRKYINDLLRRGYIINPQINPMTGSFSPMQGGVPWQGAMNPGENPGMDGGVNPPYPPQYPS